MCNNCHRESCSNCYPSVCNTCHHSPCSCSNQVPFQLVGPVGPPGPQGLQGNPGPTGPQGPAGPCPCPLSVVNIVRSRNSPPTPYSVLGTEDVILVSGLLGSVTIDLLPASNPLSKRKLYIKDAFGVSNIDNITIHPNGTDTIETVNADLIINTPFTCYELISNGSTGYNII